MVDSANERKMAMRERNRVHWANDTFMKEGKLNHDSVDQRTLEKGLNWAFMFPFCIFFWCLLSTIMYYGRRGRDEKQKVLVDKLERQYQQQKLTDPETAASHQRLVEDLLEGTKSDDNRGGTALAPALSSDPVDTVTPSSSLR
jgi:hypothetical protein